MPTSSTSSIPPSSASPPAVEGTASPGASAASGTGGETDGAIGEFCAVWKQWLEQCYLEAAWKPKVTITEHGSRHDSTRQVVGGFLDVIQDDQSAQAVA